MKLKAIIFSLLVTFISLAVFAQDNPAVLHYSNNIRKTSGIIPNSSGSSGTGANIDVVYNRIAWAVNPNDASNNITGNITTYFKTLVPAVNLINFDLNKTSFNNISLVVTYHNTNCTYSFPSSGNVNILNIQLPTTIPDANTLDSLTISYSGTPPAPSGAAQGYQRYSYTDQFSVTQYYTASLSESYEDRDWWPCKADMQDKIDSMDIQVTVPWNGTDTFWVASNGKLMDSSINGTTRVFKYKTRYPIASYLVCLSAAKFNRYYRSVQLGSTSIQVAYYLLDGKAASYYTNAVTAMDKINPVLLAYSQKLGDYPFKLEKHGYYDGLVGAGGMEHQTFITIAPGSLTSLSTLAHELMHQWFGDNVTTGL
jgi:aminopeptidase N